MAIKDTELRANFRNYLNRRDGFRDFPKISRPKVTGTFSIDRNRKYKDSLEQMNYFFYPGERVHWDLNVGYEIFEGKPESAKLEKIDHILEFIMTNWTKVALPPNHPERKKRCLNPEIICFRGCLRLLMCTPYEATDRNDGWIINVSKYKGTIYLCAEDSPEKKARVLNETEDMKRWAYYGYKFEQYILTKEPNKPNDMTQPVIQSEEFAVAFQSSFANHKLLYIAETDGIISDKPLPQDADLSKIPIEFVEVKTIKRQENRHQERNFRKYRLMNIWSQSFLCGIENVFIGERDPQGIVNRINRMQVSSMPRIARDEWCAAICMNFCIKFLDMLKVLLKNVDDPDTVYRFSFNPRVSGRIQYEVFPRKTEYSFLQPWFVDFVNKHQSAPKK
ncbi:decapping and exoribonuclease protein-like [Lutzomyia longipalpis]|uniref:decapping and exoribonuclease protein-like n=1 Tax=Lutzomyia longipalpis TaxID=7200 RepID=UPI0024842D07|nr:decapping and exoribonuclease protein-like [Lutzomyia longipalpis]